MTVRQYKWLTVLNEYMTPFHNTDEELERKYWKTIIYINPIYGAGVPGTLFDSSVKVRARFCYSPSVPNRA